MPDAHGESHRSGRGTWLRAAVLGANDGLISTSSLVLGVAAASASRSAVFVAATAGMVAGALSMAAGEYVSVSSQSDSEKAELEVERRELADRPMAEEAELARIYQSRGLDRSLAMQVARALMARDALDSHARDELGINDHMRARPLQAALASAAAFAVGALPPVGLSAVTSLSIMPIAVVSSSLVFLVILGATAARLGGAPPMRGAARVAFWGAAAMALTALVGRLFGAVV